jgi:hypothetical protein
LCFCHPSCYEPFLFSTQAVKDSTAAKSMYDPYCFNSNREAPMSENKESLRSEVEAELEREIREGRKFTLEEAIGRMAGPGSMKGASPVPRMQQAAVEIQFWLRTHLIDSGGALEVVLNRKVKGSEHLLTNFDQPLAVLASCCKQLLDSDYHLKELVRDLDVEWGRLMRERPYFEKEGSPPNVDDPYTIESVRNTLSDILKQLADVEG